MLFDFMARPTVAWITVNRDCNFRCVWCYAESTGYRKIDRMSLDIARQVVSVLIALNIKRVIIIGGEPTLWDHLFDFNDYCHVLGIETVIVTNGFMFGDDIFWERYINHPCDQINISIKATDREMFSSVVGNVCLYEKTMRGITRVFSHYESAGASIVYSNLMNIDDAIRTAETVKLLGANYFAFSLCTANVSNNVFSNEYMIDLTRLKQDVPLIYDSLDNLFNSGLSMELSLPLCIWDKSLIDDMILKQHLLGPCHMHDRSGIVFDTNGNILPCNSMTDITLIKEQNHGFCHDKVLQSLNSSDVCETYTEILRLPSIVCDDCAVKEYCRGGCLINWGVLYPDEICVSF